MRKVLALPLLALAVVLPTALATAADDVNGPACANIVDTDWGYNGNPEDPASGTTATVIIHLDVASCPYVTYTLVVLDSLSDQDFVIDGSEVGDGDPINPETGEDVVTVQATVPEGDERDGTVCLYATTSVGKHVFDRAPDATNNPDCVSLIPGGTGGASGFG
jgi:hypothetical protein